MFGEPGVSRQEQRRAAVAVTQMNGATVRKEEVKNGNGGRGRGQVLHGHGQQAKTAS